MEYDVYNGDKPYIFISYAHKDSARVIPTIRAMIDRGYRIWYDQGIEAGSEWADNIARHLSDCSAFVAFTSKNSVKSENCLDEIAFAKSKGKPSLMVFLENGVILPEGTEMQTARFQRVCYPTEMTAEHFSLELENVRFLDPCRDGSVCTAVNNATPTAPSHKRIGKRSLLMVLCAVFVAIATVCAVLGVAMNGKSKAPVETTATEAQTENEPALSSDLADFTYSLNGHVHTLPTRFPELAAEGWKPKIAGGSGETLLKPHKTLNASMSLGLNSSASVIFYNPTGNTLPVSECYITSITVQYESGISFVIAGNISFDSTFTDIIAAHGEPTSLTNDTKGYTNVKYTFNSGKPESKYVSIRLDDIPESRPAQIPETSINLYIPHNDFVIETESSDEIPSCVTDYVAPNGLGEDIFDLTFTDGTACYVLPVPLKVLYDNGWKPRTEGVSQDSEDVIGYGTSSVWLENGEYQAYASLKNEAPYQTDRQNCMVYKISFSKYSSLDVDSSCGISSDMRFGNAEIEKIINDIADPQVNITLTDGGDYAYYTITKTVSSGTVTVNVNVSKKSGYCQSLDISLDKGA